MALQLAEIEGEKSLTIIIQECCALYLINPGGNILQSGSYADTYHLSWKLTKLDESDMRDIAREVKSN